MMVLHSCTTGSFIMSNSPIAGTILHVPDGVGLLATSQAGYFGQVEFE
jgi:hypothetical protein